MVETIIGNQCFSSSQNMVNFWPHFPAFFFNHTINPAYFEIRLKTTIEGVKWCQSLTSCCPNENQSVLPKRK